MWAARPSSQSRTRSASYVGRVPTRGTKAAARGGRAVGARCPALELRGRRPACAASGRLRAGGSKVDAEGHDLAVVKLRVDRIQIVAMRGGGHDRRLDPDRARPCDRRGLLSLKRSATTVCHSGSFSEPPATSYAGSPTTTIPESTPTNRSPMGCCYPLRRPFPVVRTGPRDAASRSRLPFARRRPGAQQRRCEQAHPSR